VSRMHYGIGGLLAAFIISCSPIPETEFALASVTPTAARIDAGLAAVTVEPPSRDRTVYPLPRSLTPLLPVWQAALQDAVTRQGIFRSGSISSGVDRRQGPGILALGKHLVGVRPLPAVR